LGMADPRLAFEMPRLPPSMNMAMRSGSVGAKRSRASISALPASWRMSALSAFSSVLIAGRVSSVVVAAASFGRDLGDIDRVDGRDGFPEEMSQRGAAPRSELPFRIAQRVQYVDRDAAPHLSGKPRFSSPPP
jgi:hypothetical protein